MLASTNCFSLINLLATNKESVLVGIASSILSGANDLSDYGIPNIQLHKKKLRYNILGVKSMIKNSGKAKIVSG